jgi:endonuclease-3
MPDKIPFDIKLAMPRLRKAVRPFARAGLHDIKAAGYGSVFHILVACIISIRTRDEVAVPTALRLFEQAPTPEQVADLTPTEIDTLIHDCGFHDAKARQIHAIAARTVQQYASDLPCDPDVLLSFAGVGPKCANLVLGLACGKPSIGVDIHVHRICNRWGYVQTKSELKTLNALIEKLPRRYWIEINALLVPFGKHLCTGVRPKCSTCPLLDMCQQVGVTTHR